MVEVAFSIWLRVWMEELRVCLSSGSQGSRGCCHGRRDSRLRLPVSETASRSTAPSWAVLYYSENHSKQTHLEIASLALPTLVRTPTMIYISCSTAAKLPASVRPWWKLGQTQWYLVQVPRRPLPVLRHQLLCTWLPVAHTTMVSRQLPSNQTESLELSFRYTPPLPTGDLQPMTASFRTNSTG